MALTDLEPATRKEYFMLHKVCDGGGGGGGVEPLILSYVEEIDGTYYFDKSYAEVQNALLSGIPVYIVTVFSEEDEGETVTEYNLASVYSLRSVVGVSPVKYYAKFSGRVFSNNWDFPINDGTFEQVDPDGNLYLTLEE